MIRPKQPLHGVNALLQGKPKENYETSKVDFLLGIFSEISKEAGTKDPYALVIYLAERYHPKFIEKGKSGAKLKWTPLLKAMLSVSVDYLRKSNQPRKTAIFQLMTNGSWPLLVKESTSPFDIFEKAYKEGKKSSLYGFAKTLHQQSLQSNSGLSWEHDIKELIDKTISQD